MRLLLASCALLVLFINSTHAQQTSQKPLFAPPRLQVEPTLAPAPALFETTDETSDTTLVQPFVQTESHVMPEMPRTPEMEVRYSQPVAQQQQTPVRRRVYRRYVTYNDPHQVEYYSPSLPYYDPAHGYNSYRPLPANSRHYRGPADRHNTGWGFSY